MHSVVSLDVGTSTIRGPEVFWMDAFEQELILQFQAVLIRGDGVTALVNTAPPADLATVNAEFPHLTWALPEGDPGRLKRTREQELVPALARHGVAPADVTHVILTPLELYTTGMVTAFPRAQVCISRRGWVHFHTTHDHPHDQRWRSLSRETLVHLVVDAWDRVRLLADEDELTPNLRTWWSGAHHRESIVVEADTRDGTVCISDSFFYYENVEDGRLLGLNENMYEALAANERVLRTARHIVPIHDPKVFERYPGGVIVG